MKVELKNSLVTLLFGLLLTVSLGSASLADTTSIKNNVKNSLDSKVNTKINAVTAAAFRGTSAAEEKGYMKESLSHAGGADDRGDVMIGAQFQTATSGAAGTSTISFEASGATNTASDADYIAALVRYSKTVTTEAKKYEGPKK